MDGVKDMKDVEDLYGQDFINILTEAVYNGKQLGMKSVPRHRQQSRKVSAAQLAFSFLESEPSEAAAFVAAAC